MPPLWRRQAGRTSWFGTASQRREPAWVVSKSLGPLSYGHPFDPESTGNLGMLRVLRERVFEVATCRRSYDRPQICRATYLNLNSIQARNSKAKDCSCLELGRGRDTWRQTNRGWQFWINWLVRWIFSFHMIPNFTPINLIIGQFIFHPWKLCFGVCK